MPYQYMASKVLSKNIDASWESPSLLNTKISDIFSMYRKVYLTLHHPSVQGDLHLDLFPALDSRGMESTSQTIAQWLMWLGNRALDTRSTAPSFAEKIVRYRDAWDAGYLIKPTDHNRAVDAQIPRAEQDDLLLSKAGVNYTQDWRYLLGVVNGFVHRIGGSTKGFYIYKGGETGYIGNDTQVGLLNFKDVGSIQTIPITHDMVHKAGARQSYADCAYLKLPFDVTGKTVLLVLGGYLHVLDNVYQTLSERLVRVNIRNLALARRIFDSRHQINLNSLKIEQVVHKPDQYATSELYSDETILGYMTLPQSFLVVINRTNPFVRKSHLEITGLNGRYGGPAPNKFLPMVSELGKIVNYHPSEEDGRMIYACTPLEHHHYQDMTTQWRGNKSLDDKSQSYRPWSFSQAHLLEMGVFET